MVGRRVADMRVLQVRLGSRGVCVAAPPHVTAGAAKPAPAGDPERLARAVTPHGTVTPAWGGTGGEPLPMGPLSMAGLPAGPRTARTGGSGTSRAHGPR